MKHGQKVMNGLDAKVYFYIGKCAINPEQVILQDDAAQLRVVLAKHVTPHFEFGDRVMYNHTLCVFLRHGREKGKVCIIEEGEMNYIVVPITSVFPEKGC